MARRHWEQEPTLAPRQLQSRRTVYGWQESRFLLRYQELMVLMNALLALAGGEPLTSEKSCPLPLPCGMHTRSGWAGM